MNECPCPFVHPRKQGHSGPALFISVPARHPGMNASFYLLGGGSGWGRGRPGQAENWIGGCPRPFPRPSKGTLFGTLRVCILSPELSLGHRALTASPALVTPCPIPPPAPPKTLNPQHVAQGPSFPLVTRLLPSPRFAGVQPPLPPPPPCGGIARRGLGGAGRSTALQGRGVGKSRTRRAPSGMFRSAPPDWLKRGVDWPRAPGGHS